MNLIFTYLIYVKSCYVCSTINIRFQAVAGKGVDRHLLGLKLAAIEAGMDVPDLFMDVSYMRSSHMRLSTSQVTDLSMHYFFFIL